MALSPMMAHYLETKEIYKDEILFYRLGDFYEMFFDDAVRVSSLLDLTLTGKDCGLPERAPMCGIPFHAADQYVAKLVSFGEKVAICEQMEDPSTCKGLVKREVVKVITAGTIIESDLLNDKENNYILSLSMDDKNVGVSWCDITTGDLYSENLSFTGDFNGVCDFLLNINPEEIICSSDVYKYCYNNNYFNRGLLKKPYKYNDIYYSFSHAQSSINRHFNTLSIDSFGISNQEACAIGALFDYLNETQKHDLINITAIKSLDSKDYMMLDGLACKNLELIKSNRDGKRYGSLIYVLDKTSTAMGSRLLSNWITMPLLNKREIDKRLDGVSELFEDNVLRANIIDNLSKIKDTERLLGKISNGNATPRDLEGLTVSLSLIPNIKELLNNCSSSIISKINKDCHDFKDINSLLSSAICDNAPIMYKDGGFIKNGFDKELDRLRELNKSSESILRDIECRERERTGIKLLKVAYNRVFGYYIEVTNSFLDKVPLDYIRKQTLTGCERFITEELKNLEDEILSAKEKAVKLELEIFDKLVNLLRSNINKLLVLSKNIALLDCLCSLATVAKSNNYVRPNILGLGDELNIVEGRHPVVEQLTKDQFISNDTKLSSPDDIMMIITGPNMAGKSTFMRQVALIAIMAQIGSFVPCSKADIPLFDRIFTRVGASDNLILDQSTFMVEMSEVALILNKATKNSLIILDEVGRGTSTYDGLSIAWAVVEYLVKKVKAKTLFATHYHELSELEGKLPGVRNYKITCKEFNGSVIFLRKVVLGSANKSFGIEVAALAGVPKDVTNLAKKILVKLESNDLINAPDNDNMYDVIALNKLKNINLDEISAKDALDILYDLKKDI